MGIGPVVGSYYLFYFIIFCDYFCGLARVVVYPGTLAFNLLYTHEFAREGGGDIFRYFSVSLSVPTKLLQYRSTIRNQDGHWVRTDEAG